MKYTFIGRIRVSLDADDEEVRLTVADTGIGIAERDLPKLFERFHRVRGARSRSHEGTGIGLALVHELARLEGGDVRVTSQVGVGSRFTVALPWSATRRTAVSGPVVDGRGDAARAAAEEAVGWPTEPGDAATEPDPAYRPATGATASSKATDELAGARILLADDNADVRAYLTRLLTGQGWRVLAVTDGQQALDEIHRDLPDLVLTDVMMPVLDGFDLVRRLRADPATRTLPVLVLSARAGGEASVEGLNLGADDYLVKPFAAAELIARIRASIRRARDRTPAAALGRDPTTVAAPAPPARPAPAGPVTPAPALEPVRDAAVVAEAPADPDVLGGLLDVGWTYPSEPTSAAAMRRDVRGALGDLNVDPDVLEDLLLAASEAVNNAVEHAQRPSRPEVRMRVQVGAGLIRISVRDFGTWRDRRPAMDRGRGALLMNAYGDVRLVSTAEGTTVTIERRLA